MKYSQAFIFLVISIISSSGQSLNVSAGRLIRIENFPSRFIQPRNIDIWLPNGYAFSKKYRVLYMQDGQMLFNPDQNAHHQEWKVDETLDSLSSKAVIQDCIVVGIWNNGTNTLREYFPVKALENIPSKRRKLFIKDEMDSKPLADNYLKFVVQELKPYVDKNFSVLIDKQNTLIAGSGDGGLISIYAVCEYPTVFHSAAILSMNTYGPDDQILKAILKYLKKNIPDPSSHGFYFDCRNLSADQKNKNFQMKLNALFNKKKYTKTNYLSVENTRDIMTEDALSEMLYMPMVFLLGK